MHDFQCVNAKDMYAEELSERFRYFKETEGGMGEMCKVVEERAKEYAADALQKREGCGYQTDVRQAEILA